MRKLRLCITDNSWPREDRTLYESYGYSIVDDLCSEEIDSWDGFDTREEARRAGMKRLAELESRL